MSIASPGFSLSQFVQTIKTHFKQFPTPRRIIVNQCEAIIPSNKVLLQTLAEIAIARRTIDGFLPVSRI
jgi:hypothetical protein